MPVYNKLGEQGEFNIEYSNDWIVNWKLVWKFGEYVLVFKVMNKMFALTGLEGDPPYMNLKYDPERAIELREQYEAIQPGWHMNKVI